MGGSRHDRLERLIEEVAHGKRDLAGIHDERLREAVRIALRMHATAPDGPDAGARTRMRERVLGGIRPRPVSLLDRLTFVFEMLASPAPYIVRAAASLAIVLSLAAGATVASADTLPDDPLYAVKIASEDLRLTFATTAEDRASVELSIAEHRLAEAERLALSGRADDAIVASSSYTEHVARAAAQLAQLETAAPTTSSLLTQLDARFSEQRARALTLSVMLTTNPATAGGGEVLATFASPTLAPGRTQAERVAETAAGMAQELARVATARAEEQIPAGAPARVEAVKQTDAPRTSPDAARSVGAQPQTPRSAEPARRSDAPRATTGQASTGQSTTTGQSSSAAQTTTAAPNITEQHTTAQNPAPNKEAQSTTGNNAKDATPAAKGNDRPSEQSSRVVEATRRSADEARKAADEAKSPKHEKSDTKSDKNDKGGAKK